MTSTAEQLAFNRFESPIRRGAFWFIAVGLAMIIIGTIMATNLAIATMVAMFYIGVMMIVGGVLQIGHAIAIGRFCSPWLWAVFGLLYLLAGVLVLIQPTFAMSVLTFALAFTLLAAGIVRLIVALSARPSGWRGLVVSALITMAAGVIVSLGWPGNSAWVLGLFLCVDFVMQGCALLFIGLALRSA